MVESTAVTELGLSRDVYVVGHRLIKTHFGWVAFSNNVIIIAGRPTTSDK